MLNLQYDDKVNNFLDDGKNSKFMLDVILKIYIILKICRMWVYIISENFSRQLGVTRKTRIFENLEKDIQILIKFDGNI